MKFYDPFNMNDITKIGNELEADGFLYHINPSVTISLKREDNPYKKSLKWHVTGKQQGNKLFSQWFKTKKEALDHITRTITPFKVGESFSLTPYQWEK